MNIATISDPALKMLDKMQSLVSSECTNCLYDLYAQRVYNKCLKMTKSEEDANDLSQEIWIKVQKNITKFNNKSSPSTWLYSITYNHCIDFIRRKNRRLKVHTAYKSEQTNDNKTTANLLEIHAQNQHDQRLHEKVRKLAQGEKMNILWMKYGNDMSVKEIGKALNLSDSAVKMRLQRARRCMKKEIEFSMAS